MYNTVYICINTDMHMIFRSLCIFTTRRPDTNENGWPRWSNVSEHLCYSLLRILHLKHLQGFWLRWSISTDYSSQDLTKTIPIFSGLPPKYQHSQTTRNSLGKDAHIPKILAVDVCYHSRGPGCKLLLP